MPPGGLHRNRVVRTTDHPDMTSAVDRELKALNQINKQSTCYIWAFVVWILGLDLGLKFQCWIWVLIASVPDLCIPFSFTS